MARYSGLSRSTVEDTMIALAPRKHRFVGTDGDDRITGTSGGDNFVMDQHGRDRVHGLGGNDHFNFGTFYTRHDRVFGGSGHDTVTVDAGRDTDLVLDPTHLRSVEAFIPRGGDISYAITILDGFDDLTVGDEIYTAVLAIDGSQVTTGSLVLNGEYGADTIVGGTQDDTIAGGARGDRLSGGGGNDDFFYRYLQESGPLAIGEQVDVITDLNAGDSISFGERIILGSTYHLVDKHSGDYEITLKYVAATDQTEVNLFPSHLGREPQLQILLDGRHTDAMMVDTHLIFG